MRLVVMGTGGHARELLDVLEDVLGRETALGQIVLFAQADSVSSNEMEISRRRGYELVSTLQKDATHYVPAVGDPKVRRRLSDLAERYGLLPETVVSPASRVPENSSGPGLVCFPGSYVSTDVTIGRHCHINQGCRISHDVRLGDFVSLSPGVLLTGGVIVEEYSFVGAGAVILPNVRVGLGATVGAGAVVVRDVAPGQTVAGNPAREIKVR